MHKKEIKVTQKLRKKSFNKNFCIGLYNNIAFTKVEENPKLSLNTNHLATLSILRPFYTLSSYTLSLQIEIYIFVSELLTFKERVRVFSTHPVYSAKCFVYKCSINVDHPCNKFFDMGNGFLYE